VVLIIDIVSIYAMEPGHTQSPEGRVSLTPGSIDDTTYIYVPTIFFRLSLD
jgi:hypothetical protein